jgi:uncharacterized Zn-binding protein involved in type VI secretion
MSEQEKSERTYLFATVGSRTGRGGQVTRATTKAEYQGMAFARVGDVVTYGDGSEATIVDGAWFAAMWEDKPFALVGSRLSNGDTITETLQDECGIEVRDGEQISGLFNETYTLPQSAAHGGSTNA